MVTVWIKGSGQLNPHLKTLSPADDEVIVKITICVMLLSILSRPGFDEVNRTDLQRQSWEVENKMINDESRAVNFLETLVTYYTIWQLIAYNSPI